MTSIHIEIIDETRCLEGRKKGLRAKEKKQSGKAGVKGVRQNISVARRARKEKKGGKKKVVVSKTFKLGMLQGRKEGKRRG